MATDSAPKKQDNRACITPEFRVSFPAIFEPKAFQGQKPKFSLVMLFDKKIDLSKPSQVGKDGKPIGVSMKHAAFNAAVEEWGPKDKWPKNLKLPFRDGEEKPDLQGYENTIFVSATSMIQPGLVNQALQKIISPSEFYAGCYARAEVFAFTYDVSGNRGVSFGLRNIQKIRDGEQFSGRKDASQVFDAIADNSEDASSYDTASADLGF